MARSYWLVNSNRSRVKRFIENTNNKDQFFKYMFVDSGKVTSTWGKEPPVMTTREELKIEKAREEWKSNFTGLASNARSMAITGDTSSKVIQRYSNPRPFLARRDFKTNEK